MTPAIDGKTNCADTPIDPPRNNNIKKYFLLISINLNTNFDFLTAYHPR